MYFGHVSYVSSDGLSFVFYRQKAEVFYLLR